MLLSFSSYKWMPAKIKHRLPTKNPVLASKYSQVLMWEGCITIWSGFMFSFSTVIHLGLSGNRGCSNCSVCSN